MLNANYLTIPQQNIQSNNTYKLLTEDMAGDFELDPNPVSLVCKKLTIHFATAKIGIYFIHSLKHAIAKLRKVQQA